MTTSPDPFPWPDDADGPADTPPPGFRGGRIPLGAPSGTDLLRSRAVLDLVAAHGLLDGNADDPTRRETAGNVRDTLVDVVQTRAQVRAKERPAKVASATDVRLEVVGLSDDADTLTAIGDAFHAAAKESRQLASDLIDEVPRARRSIRVADGRGFEVTVSRNPRTELSVDVDAVVDVIAAAAVSGWVDDDTTKVYARGIRDGVAGLRDVLATSPSFRSTALDSLATRLEDAGEDNLAKRLRAAYARVDKGDPTPKIDRKPLPTPKGQTP